MKPKIPKKFISQTPKPLQKCYACSGSGYYDNTGSPKCSACDGTGLEKDQK